MNAGRQSTGMTVAMEDEDLLRDFDLRNLPPAFHENPYQYYHALRRASPVRLMPDGSYLLTRYRDVDSVYRNKEAYSSDKKIEFGAKFGDTPLFAHHTTSLVFNDPPLHSRVRRILAGALTPRAVAAMEPDLLRLVEFLLDGLEKSADVDLIDDYAAAIPVEVIGNLLAIPHEERGPLRDWSLAILGALEPAPSVGALDRGNAAVSAFIAYLDDLVRSRTKRPGDPDKDVLTRLIQGVGETGEALSNAELLHNCIFILNAGHETTTNLIGNGLFALQEWPGERRRLIENPDLIQPAIEEFLRFESSNQLGNRSTRTEVTLGDVTIPAGGFITLCIGAANRDPEQFPEPDRLDISRQSNRHLAFGAGIHQCAGLALARLEGAVAIGGFLSRFPRFQIGSAVVRGRRARFRGFVHLPAYLH